LTSPPTNGHSPQSESSPWSLNLANGYRSAI
jgi:hypothetical protein